MDAYATHYLRQFRYTATNPRHEQINGYTVLFAQDQDDAWKYKIKAPYEMWSAPFDSFDAAYSATLIELF